MGTGLSRDPALDSVSFQGAARPVGAAEEPGGHRPSRPGRRPHRRRPGPRPPAVAARRVLGAGADARGSRGRGTAA